jgi:hypothetical protein
MFGNDYKMVVYTPGEGSNLERFWNEAHQCLEDYNPLPLHAELKLEYAKATEKVQAAEQSEKTALTFPWHGDDWDALEPRVRQLLSYMYGRERADLRDLCPAVWGKEYLTVDGVTESARQTATSKANSFLSKRQWPRLLSKVRKEPYLYWE